MISCNIPLLMVVAFLLLTLVVGIYFSRKTITFREYAVGNKQFATATLVATVLATAYSGGGLVRNVQYFHSLGLYWIILMLLASFDFSIVGVLALRMGPFMKHLSMPESIGSVYGKYPRVITALFSICDAIAMTATQISAMSLAIGVCIDVEMVNPQIITVFSTLILIFYSTFGGIRAVTFTDVLQFVTFTIIIPFLAWFMFVKTGKPISEIITFLQSQEKFQFSSVFRFDTNLLAMVALVLSFLMSYIDSPAIQRVYMASDPVQARRVFLYATLFGFIMMFIIILISLFVFVGAPELPIATVWDYIMTHIPPIFKGLVAVSLLAMAMSTADSKLNACSVMISHDIVESLRGIKTAPYTHQLRLARLSTLVVGLFAMILTFYCNDLLELLKLSMAFALPIIPAPFILAVFGFRGTSRTALIGMATGALAILSWKKWIEPITNIDGAFVSMLANGLAMMAAHYRLPQPEGAGWVGPDDHFKQFQQAKERKRARIKEEIKDFFLNVKENLAKLKPGDTNLVGVGFYVIITALFTYFIVSGMDHIYWFMLQIILGLCFACYGMFARYKTFFKKRIPDWIFGPYWLIGLVFCLPGDTLWNWWHVKRPFVTVALSLAHLGVTLFVLPSYLGIGLVVVTLLIAIYPICCIGLLLSVLLPLLSVLGAGLLLFAIIIYLKRKLDASTSQIRYLKEQQALAEAQQLKKRAYDSSIVPSATPTSSDGDGTILKKIIEIIEQSISFFDENIPLYKQDFQSIINKLYEWVIHLKKKEQARDHILLQPTEITLDKLMHHLEFALSQEVVRPPRLLIEQIAGPNGTVPPSIICDINQTLYLLVKAVLRVMQPNSLAPQLVKLQLYTSHLTFEKGAPINKAYPPAMTFPAIALVLSNTTQPLPEVDGYYAPIMEDTEPKEQRGQTSPKPIDLQQETIASIIRAHCGYLEYPADTDPNVMLLVLPTDLTTIRKEMITKLPIDCLASETAVTPKEQADSMMVLMDFHEFVCRLSSEIEPSIITSLIQLLRQRFGVKRHASGQLFYVRAVGIARIVAEWIFHSPKPIYASLLYDLVRYTCLPLSYIKAHYNLGVYVFVQNVLGVDKHQEMDHPSLLYVKNRMEEAIAQDHVQLSVLFIKLAERLYDLHHCEGFASLEEVTYMAKETLTVDIELANHYLDTPIAEALEAAAKQALDYLERKNKGN